MDFFYVAWIRTHEGTLSDVESDILYIYFLLHCINGQELYFLCFSYGGCNILSRKGKLAQQIRKIHRTTRFHLRSVYYILRFRKPEHVSLKIHWMGFEPTKDKPSDLKSDPFDRSGTNVFVVLLSATAGIKFIITNIVYTLFFLKPPSV